MTPKYDNRRGSKNPMSKLTEEMVREIKRRWGPYKRYSRGRDGLTRANLAEEYGISQAAVYQVLVGRMWRHVEDEG